MNKRAIVFALVVILLGVVIYIDSEFNSTAVREFSITDEKILNEMPDILLSKEDVTLGKKLLAAPEVQVALAQEVGMMLEQEVTKRLLEGYSLEGITHADIEVSLNAVYVNLHVGGEKRTILTFFMEEQYAPQKVIFLYSLGINDRIKRAELYENSDGGLKKFVLGRRWFSEFRDRMWEE